MSRLDLRAALPELRQALADQLGLGEGHADLAALRQAELVLEPGGDTQPKTIPLETVAHKLVMVRDRLRLIEQGVNSAAQLSDLDKLRLQAHVTRVQEAVVALGALLTR